MDERIKNNGLNSGVTPEDGWQAPHTADEYQQISKKRQGLLHRQQSGMITPQESEELARLTTLSHEYAAGVASMLRDIFTGEGGRSYDLRNPKDRAEMAEKLRVFREGPQINTDIGGAPILPHQSNHPHVRRKN